MSGRAAPRTRSRAWLLAGIRCGGRCPSALLSAERCSYTEHPRNETRGPLRQLEYEPV
jgi:hypothetical protein